MEHQNFDLTNISTPLKVDVLERLLIESNYDSVETDFLVQGFRNGFDLGYAGPVRRRDKSHNIPITVGSKIDMWNKIMVEVGEGRYAGPYEQPPFEYFVQSPIGLVPKAGGKTRLIFHLSYNFKNGNKSINHWTPAHLCSVKYHNLDHAVRTTLKLLNILNKDLIEGDKFQTVFYARTDLKNAFRVLPLLPGCWKWTVLCARHPLTNALCYFINKNLPFGSSISCSHFQCLSNGLDHLVRHRFGGGRVACTTNYLDDFLFVHVTQQRCNNLVSIFLQICEEITLPVSHECYVGVFHC